MADVKSPPHGTPKLTANPLFLRDEELRQAIEMLFFAYRDFTGVADEILADYGFGRAHHRAIYFIGRHPGMTVSDLLRILRITKQSLNRVLSQLIDEDYVSQQQGSRDRRQRLLRLTDKGRALEERLSVAQRTLIAGAYREVGAEAVDGFRKVLLGIMNSEEDRERFERPTTPRR
jgi:DNA-binding MarR family transcriptional regulator